MKTFDRKERPEDLKKVICNKKGAGVRCGECHHAHHHFPIGDCDKVSTRCTPDLDKILTVETQCAR